MQLLGFATRCLSIVVLARGKDDAARRVDDHAAAGEITSGSDRRIEITALRPDAWNEERHVRRDPAHARELVRRRSADHESAVVVRVPLGRHGDGDIQIERANILLDEALELPGSRVRRPAQDEDALGLAVEERLERLGPHVGVHRDCVGLADVERERHVVIVRVADVGALGVEDDRNAWRMITDVRARLLERLDPLGSVGLVEGGVDLVRTHEIGRRLHDLIVETDDRVEVSVAPRRFGQLAVLAIESDTHELVLGPTGIEELAEISFGQSSPLH